MASTLKRVKKPVNYIVVNRNLSVVGKSKTLRGAMNLSRKKKNVSIVKIDKAWERGKPVKKARKRVKTGRSRRRRKRR